MAHPISENCLQRFARGKATRDERRTILAHLIRGCPVCSRALQACLDPPSQEQGTERGLDRPTRGLPPDPKESALPRFRPGPALSF
jgi:hypothetical protein